MSSDSRPFHPGIHRYNGQKSLNNALGEDRITPADRNLITLYVAERQASRHIGDHRKNKIVFTLVGWRRFLDPPYADATISDIYVAISALKEGKSARGKPFKRNTIHDYIRILKPFLLWLIENEYNTSLPERKVRKISSPSVDYQTTEPDELLTPQEIEALISACLNPRDRALISVLYESGCRISELARIRWRDVIFDQYGVRLYIFDNKEEKRRYSRLTISTDYLAAWKNDYHPGDPEGNALVFQTFKGNPLDYVQARRVIDRATARAGIEKRVTPHLFRHSRITHMITQGYQESVIKKSMWGNVDTSMFKTYVNLGDQDIDNEFLDKAGIVSKAETAPPIRPRICPRCHRENGPTFEHCMKCGEPLTEEARARQDNHIGGLFNEVETDPRFAILNEKYEELKALIKEKGLT